MRSSAPPPPRLTDGWTASALVYVALVWVATWYFRARSFDFRNLEAHRLDTAWQLELVWQATQGQFVGRDFMYARGPLWQLIAWLGSGPPDQLSLAVARLEATFQLLSLGLVWVIVSRTLEAGGRRAVGFLVLASMAFGAGIATFRALASLAVIVLLWPAFERHERRGPLWAGLLVAAMVWFSFDRALLGVAQAAAVLGYGLLWAKLNGRPLADVGRRLVGFLTGLFGATAILVAVGLALGFRPLGYLAAQRQIASSYTALSTEWEAGVRLQNVVGLLVVAGVLALLPLLRRGEPRLGAWLVAALSTASFAVILPDPGHVYIALLPLMAILLLSGLATQGARWGRALHGVVGSVAVLGWFGAHPSSLWTSPQAFARAYGSFRETAVANPRFETDVSHALAFAREQRREGCMGFAPALTILHALADVPGPTELSLRWSPEQQLKLAEGLARSECPAYVHQLMSFEAPRGSEWLLGPDFVELAETYSPKRWLLPATVVLERQPRREAKTVQSALQDVVLDVPLGGQVIHRLPFEVSGDQLLKLALKLQVEPWAVRVGATPELHYRSWQSGQPVGEFRPIFHLTPNRDVTAYLALDAQVLEERWLLGRDSGGAVADTLEFAVRGKGRFSPRLVQLHLGQVTALDPPRALDRGAAHECTADLDLTRELALGRGVPRNTGPEFDDRAFSLHPNPFPEARAEVFFPLRVCEGSCVAAELQVRADTGDGVAFQVHTIWSGTDRALRFERHLVPGHAHPVEIALPATPNHSVWLRFGTLPGEDSITDYAVVNRPRIVPCSARGALRAHLDAGRARREGDAVYLETPGEIAFGAVGGAVRKPLWVAKDTCLTLAFETRADAEVSFQYAAYIVVDGIEHRVAGQALAGGQTAAPSPIGLFDWEGRSVELLVAAFSPRASEAARGVVTRARLHECGGS